MTQSSLTSMHVSRLFNWTVSALAAGMMVLASPVVLAQGAIPTPVFKSSSPGEFTFDTGILRGALRAQGKSLGLSAVVHTPTGQRLDRSNGLLSHYRVFTKGVRYGGGAWDWPSTARLTDQGAVEVFWAAAPDRPFEMRATYRWLYPSTLQLITRVKALQDLQGFESFLANYFHEAFTNSAVLVKTPAGGEDQGRFMPALPAYGDWLMFPRDAKAVELIRDGRWKLEPHPVDWVIMPEYKRPTGFRHAPSSDVTVVLASRPSDCFALATPHQIEAHYSLYLSLFGHDLKAGQEAQALTHLFVSTAMDEKDLIELNPAAPQAGFLKAIK